MPAIAVLVLIASVVVVSVAAWTSASLKRALILSPMLVMRGQVHRLLTAGWIHADIAHLGFNLLTLWFFAPDVVKVLGEVRFVALYVSAVVVSFIPTTIRYRRDPRYAS